jgi:hypothetical protein
MELPNAVAGWVAIKRLWVKILGPVAAEVSQPGVGCRYGQMWDGPRAWAVTAVGHETRASDRLSLRVRVAVSAKQSRIKVAIRAEFGCEERKPRRQRDSNYVEVAAGEMMETVRGGVE